MPNKFASTTFFAATLILPGIGCSADAQEAGAPAANTPAAESADAGDTLLTVGSVAPPLDVEHWVQDGEGKFQPVSNFEAGKVYLVEFWATWCPPCVASMPHLSQLQRQYADRGVTIVSISSEPLDTVTAFLEREADGQTNDEGEPITFDEVTKHYCLTTDPDGSSSADYMEAAMQNGIPAAFLVGKEGRIEWIGHPMEVDDALEQVVTDTWDRELFAAEFQAKQRMQVAQSEIIQLIQAGDYAGARAKLDGLMADGPTDELKAQAERLLIPVENMIFQQLLASDPAAALPQFNRLMELTDGEPQAVNAFAWAVAATAKSGGKVSSELFKAAEAAVAEAVEVGGRETASLLDTQAHLAYHQGDVDRAIALEEQAAEGATGRLKAAIVGFLEQLKTEKESGAEG